MDFISKEPEPLQREEIHVDAIYDQLILLDRITSLSEYSRLIPELLENIGRYTRSDRISIFKTAPDGYENFMTWHRFGLSSSAHSLSYISAKEIPHFQHAFLKKSSLAIWDMKDISYTMPEEYALLCPLHIHRMVAFPLFSGVKCHGFLELVNPDNSAYTISKKFLQVITNHLGFIHENLQIQEQLKEQMRDMAAEKHILDTLSADFSAVYRCDLTTNQGEVLKLPHRFQSLDFQNLTYTGLIQYMYDHEVVPDSFPDFLQVFHPDHLQVVLSTQRRVSYHLRSIPNDLGYEHFEIQISRLCLDDDHFHLLIGVRPIDNLLREKEQLHQRISTAEQKANFRYDIIQSIGKMYGFIYLVNLKDKTLLEITSTQAARQLLAAQDTLEEKIKGVVHHLIGPDYRTQMTEFLSLSTLRERLKDKETITYEYMNNHGHWSQGRFMVKRRDADGLPVTVLYLVRNIDDTKRQEIAYQQKLEQIAREATMANQAKTHFLRRMSHDIRTPINGILGTIEVANSCPDDTERQQLCRDQIKNASTTLLEMVNDVLDMNKLESGAVEMEEKPFSIEKLMKELYHLIDMQAPTYGVTVSVKHAKYMHRGVIGSAPFLRRILLNLAGNALKYNRQDGTISLSCEEVESHGNQVTYRFTCEDTGLGMSEEFQKHAFEPFTQEANSARTHYMGTGLGLAIVKELVEKMDGTISLYSQEGKGSRFTVEIPFSIAKKEVESQEERKKPISFKGIRVLLAEDNELNRDIAKFLLEKEGIDVECAENGKEALDLFRKSPLGFFHAIFMDIMMPLMGGYESCRQIRALSRKDAMTIPIFAMTANAFYDDIKKSQEAGMNEHLTKPLNMEVILETLKKYLNQ